MEQDSFSQKLDLLIRLTAISLTDGKPLREQIKLLSKSGFQPKEIAEILDTTPNTVSVTLTSIRKSNGKTKKRTKKHE